MSYILVGSLTRLKTLVYKINGAEYIKVYIKQNGELNPGVIPWWLWADSKISLGRGKSKISSH